MTNRQKKKKKKKRGALYSYRHLCGIVVALWAMPKHVKQLTRRENSPLIAQQGRCIDAPMDHNNSGPTWISHTHTHTHTHTRTHTGNNDDAIAPATTRPARKETSFVAWFTGFFFFKCHHLRYVRLLLSFLLLVAGFCRRLARQTTYQLHSWLRAS